jgi:RND family efflux transporter MFP subunit
MSTTERPPEQQARHEQPELPGPPQHPLLPSPKSPPNSNGDGKNQDKPGDHQHDHHVEGAIPDDLPKIKTWAVILAGIIVIAAFVGLFLIGFIPREKRLSDLKKESQEQADARPHVLVQKAEISPAIVDVELPADATAWQQTAIYPQINGYLAKQNVDIGDPVKTGQLLAVISAPDIDAQLAQSVANVAQSQAALVRTQDNYALAQATLTRYEGFFKTGGITQQQLDQYRTSFTQAKANLAGAQANLKAANASVERYAALQKYENIIAPFNGTITTRNYDLGALMSASNSTPGKEIFDIANTDVLRVFVDVDQVYVTSAKVGDPAAVEVRNYPGRQFPGKIARTAGALDPNTRKMRYEIDVPNYTNLLYPGMYAQAVLKIKQSHPSILVPTSALIFDSAGTRIWIADGDIAHVRKVTVGRDFGTQIEITTGLSGDEQIITNPGEQLAEGVKIDVTAGPTTAPTAQSPTTQP